MTAPVHRAAATSAATASRPAVRGETASLEEWLHEAALPSDAFARVVRPSDYRRQRLERLRWRLDRLCPTSDERRAWWMTPIQVLGDVTPQGELARGRIGALFVGLRQAELAARRSGRLQSDAARRRCGP